MSEASEQGAIDRTPDGDGGDRQTDGGDVGGRSCETFVGGASEGSGEDDQLPRPVGRPSDYGETKRTRTIRLTNRHWELWGKAAYPETKTKWLERHLDEHADKIEQKE
jgi:hypothetical protein